MSDSMFPAYDGARPDPLLCDDFVLDAAEIDAPQPPNPSPILKLNADVFAIISTTLLRSRHVGFNALLRLSLCCRFLRSLSLPALFSRCAIIRENVTGVPPLAIRPHVRHLTYHWYVYHAQFYELSVPETVMDFKIALRYLPFVRSVTFTSASVGVPWKALEMCLSFPQVKSISFTESATFIHVPPFPTDAASSSSLEKLSYPTPLIPYLPFTMDRLTTFDDMCALEEACLSSLVLGMHSTARSLALPMTTAPLRDMAKVDWPALQGLTLAGSLPANADKWATESTFQRMPALRRLAITAALTHTTTIRYCVLGPCRTSSIVGLTRLQSLTIAYPDPNDAIFSVSFPDLSHLSLRDWPRHYDILAHEYYNRTFRSPILFATEALSILRRLRAPSLTTLQLVYTADDADDALLSFIAHAFPKLKRLQLHRYRRSSEQIVDHRRIAQALSASRSLVSLRLNLDFQGDPGEYKRDVGSMVLKHWRGQLSTFGWEILSIMAPCPLLERVALLYHGEPPSMWVWHYRSRQATRRLVFDRSAKKRDTFAPQYPFGERERGYINRAAVY